jgi:signal transduction histidine kinase
LNAQSSSIAEIDDLAYAINSTAVQLREAIDAGRKAQVGLAAARDRLEIRVDERTAELQREIEVRREAEEKALSEQRSAEKANKAKSDFLANMSHELRTPLNHIIGFIELVNDPRVGTLSDVQKEYLTDALGSGQHLLSLINDVLDLAKVESGKMSIKTSVFDPRAMLESNIRSLEGQAIQKSISVNLECVEIPETITADEQKLTQVMFNLLSNALKFTPSGGRITVRSSVVESSKQAMHSLRIDVTDTGIGIEKENLQRVFRPFEQVDGDRIRVIAGTGLGLALSQRLIDLHGGEIWAESPGPDLGTTFSFTIPI